MTGIRKIGINTHIFGMGGGGLGPDVVVNGDFTTDTVWIKGTGATIADGVAHLTDVGAIAALQQNGILTIGTTYRVTYTILNWSVGSVKVRVGFTFGTARNANGTYTEDIECTGIDRLYINGNNAINTMDIDDISAMEV